MGDVFERVRWARPDDVVLVGYQGAFESRRHARLTAAEADDLANGFANAAIAAGLRPGQVVLMVCENSVEALLAKIGLAKAGVVVAPINPALADDVVVELAALVEPSAMIVDVQFLPRLGDLLVECGQSPIVAIDIGTDRESVRPAGSPPSFAEFIDGSPTNEPEVEIHGDDIWQILFTSGTSSTPKAVLIPHIKTVLEAMSLTDTLTRGQRYDHAVVVGEFLPIVYHVGDITLWSAILVGGSAVIGRRAVPEDLASAIERHSITGVWAGSPQVVQALARVLRDRPEVDASSLTSIVFGFAPLPPSTFRELRDVLGDAVECVEIVGQTELCCCHRFSLSENEELYERAVPAANYVGRPHPLMAATLLDSDRRFVTPGSERSGEGVFRSPALTPGYYRNSAATEEAMVDGWFRGGDLFRDGESGQRILVDRLKDVVKTGGENVSSLRVEQVLMQHPAVGRAAVIGLPHDRWGEAVTAVVTCDEQVEDSELIDHCRALLAGFEIPKRIVFVDSFPEATAGKIRKNVLREQLSELYRPEWHDVPHAHGVACYWDHREARWSCGLVSTVTRW